MRKIFVDMRIKILIGVLIVGIFVVAGLLIWKYYQDKQIRENAPYVSIIPERPASLTFRLKVVEALDNSSKYLENQEIVVGLHYYTSPPPPNFFSFLSNLHEGVVLEIRAISEETQKPIRVRGIYISPTSEKEKYVISIGNSPNWQNAIRIIK